MKKKGFTIIEAVIVIALLGVIFLLTTPLIRSFGGVSNRSKTQKEIDAEFSVINEFIQNKIRSAKSSGDYAEVHSSFSNPLASPTSQDGSVLYLEIPLESGSIDGVSFSFEKVDNNDADEKPSILVFRKELGGQRDILMENVNNAYFRFQEGIVIYYIDYGKDFSTEERKKFRTSFKGSASTRIDFNN